MGDPRSSEIEILARGVAWRDGRVLLCRNLKYGHTYLPGGHVEPHEAAAEACAREFMEETGMRVLVGSPLLASELRFTQRGKQRHEITLVFHVEHESGMWPEVIDSRESKIGFEWVNPGQIASASFLPESIRPWLEGLQESVLPEFAWLSYTESDLIRGQN
jgi:ADP-ribose pyrophosphatase YjhB (NUDIX family)